MWEMNSGLLWDDLYSLEMQFLLCMLYAQWVYKDVFIFIWCTDVSCKQIEHSLCLCRLESKCRDVLVFGEVREGLDKVVAVYLWPKVL